MAVFNAILFHSTGSFDYYYFTRRTYRISKTESADSNSKVRRTISSDPMGNLHFYDLYISFIGATVLTYLLGVCIGIWTLPTRNKSTKVSHN